MKLTKTIVLLWLFAVVPAQAGGTTQSLGRSEDILMNELQQLKIWPFDPPVLLWKAPLGEGHSSVSVSEGLVFASFLDGGEQSIAAFDKRTGKELWRQPLDQKNQAFVKERENDCEVKAADAIWSRENQCMFYQAEMTEYILGENGMMVRVKQGKKISEKPIALSARWAAPTFANGRLYTRDDQQIYCVDISIVRTTQKYEGRIFPRDEFFRFRIGDTKENAIRIFGEGSDQKIQSDTFGATGCIVYYTMGASFSDYGDQYDWKFFYDEKGGIVRKVVGRSGS